MNIFGQRMPWNEMDLYSAERRTWLMYVNIDQSDGNLQWTLNGEIKFSSLQRLLQFLESKVQ